MSRAQRIRFTAVLFGFLFPLVNCQPFPARKGPVDKFDINVLTNAQSIRTRLGGVLAGYLAEYELNLQKHRVFISLEILKYRKGERLTVRGRFVDDSVRISYGDQMNAEVPVFHILRAAPAPPATPEKKLGP
ncbi:MAG: hypothetical protein ABSG19_05935 [Candidatus Aminicenantales bacterium]